MSLTAEEIRECTMIALDQPPFWPEDSGNPYVFKFTIYIDGSQERPLTYKTPLMILRNGIINWGDGTEEEQSIPRQFIRHSYNHSGYYQITILSDRSYSSFSFCRFESDHSLVSIDTPIPISAHEETNITINNINYILLYYLNNFNFVECDNLISIPENLFKNVKNVWNTPILIDESGNKFPYPDATDTQRGAANNQFYKCLSLKNIPIDLYKNTGVKSAVNTFYGCISLNCDLGGIFENCIYLRSAYGCFEGCSLLNNLQNHIFYNCKSLRNLRNAFRSCIGLRAVPNGIFDMIGIDENILAGYEFQYCFSGCISLNTIPDELFKNLLQGTAIDFSGCFDGCSALREIPDDIFSGCVGATTFQYCFEGCSLLSTIPDFLFYDCPSVDNFAFCFNYCYGLTYIPSSLFNRCHNVRIFRNCFANCSSIESNVPRLWESHPGATDHANCFYGCYSAANYADIPFGWKR